MEMDVTLNVHGVYGSVMELFMGHLHLRIDINMRTQVLTLKYLKTFILLVQGSLSTSIRWSFGPQGKMESPLSERFVNRHRLR